MSIKPFLLCCCLLFCLLPACNRPENIKIKLTSRERALIDTMYMEKIKALRPYWDSLCAVAHDSLLQIAVDSIIKVRRIEEEQLRARIAIPSE